MSISIAQTQDPLLQKLQSADQLFQQREYAQALAVYEEVAKDAEQKSDKEVLLASLAQISRCYLIQDQPETGKVWLEKTKAIATPEYPKGWSRYLGVWGRFQWKAGDREKATQTFQEWYRFAYDHQLHNEAIDAAHMIAITGTPEDQVVWAKKGILAAEQGNLEGWLGPLWNNLAWTYSDQGNNTEALEALLKAREYHWKKGDEHSKLVADWGVGSIYRKLQQHEKSLMWLRPTLAWAQRRHEEKKSPETAEWVGLTLQELAEVAYAQGKLEQGLQDFRQAQEYLLLAKMPEWDAKAYGELLKKIETLTHSLKK